MVVATLAATMAYSQESFILDTTFRSTITRKAVNSVLPRPDGTIIASGIMRFPGEFSDQRLVRLLPSGSRDPSFNNSGLGGSKIIPWQDKLYVDGGLIRRILLPSGNLDPSFRVGYLTIPYFSILQGGDYHVFPDGRVLLSGQYLLSDTARGFVGQYSLVWITNTGYLDTTRVHHRANGPMWEFTQMPNGKFVCSCSCSQYDGQPVDKLFRIEADGSLDTSFHTGVTWAITPGLLPMADNRLYVAGWMRREGVSQDTLRLVRLLPNGSLDPVFTRPSFGAGELPLALGAVLSYIYPWSDGRLIVAGYYQMVNGQPRGGICMIDSTGQLLEPFDGTRIGSFTYQSFTYGSIDFVTQDADGALLVCGAYKGYNDGLLNDTLQHFVSRLLIQDVSTGTTEIPLPTSAACFSVQPNPVSRSGSLQVAIDLPEYFTVQGSLRLTITDALGRLVLEQQLATGARSANLPITGALAVPGLYHLHLSDASRWISGATFVVE